MRLSFPVFPFPILVLLLGLGASRPEAQQLKERLGLFIDLRPEDSIVALRPLSEDRIEVEVMDKTSFDRRKAEAEVGGRAASRLLEMARAEQVAVVEGSSAPAAVSAPPPGSPALTAPAAAPAAVLPAAPEATTRPAISTGMEAAPASTSRQRWLYTSTQTALTTFIYGVSVPLALEVESYKVYTGLPLIIAPLGFYGHFALAKNYPVGPAHLAGTTYLSLASLFSSYALPLALLPGEEETRVKTGTVLSLGLYPLGLYGGFLLGDAYARDPGRIQLQSKFATGFGALGLLTPLLYFDDVGDHSDLTLRLMFGQSLAFGTAGHFLAQYYRTGETVPGGVSSGILTHAGLGALLGLNAAALLDAGSLRGWLGPAVLGGTLGFGEGLWYYHDKYDTEERAFYNLVGAGVGWVFGLGVFILVNDEDASSYAETAGFFTSTTLGTLAGYAATNYLTRDMVQKPNRLEGAAARPAPAFSPSRLSFSPPAVEPDFYQGHREGIRYRLAALQYRLP